VGPFAKVRLPKVSFKGDQPHGAALSLRSGRAVVFYLDAMLGDAKKTKVFLCDVKNGAVLQESSRDGAYFPFDFDASGTRVLCRRDSRGTGQKDTAEVWSLTAEGPGTLKRWVPYADEAQKDRDLIWAAFTAANRIATLSSGGQLAVWDAATFKRVCSVEASTAIPAVSPNGSYVAFARGTNVGLLDVDTGAIPGFLPLGGEVQSASLAFRSDGQALLCAAKDKVTVFDLAAGRSRTTSVPGVKGQGLHPLPSVGWADDRLLFVNNCLVDPDTPVPIWNYMGSGWARPAGNHVWFLATKGQTEVGLVPLRLPHPGAVRKMMAARSDSSSFLLKPGDAVQVDVRKVPGENQGAAQRALESVLRGTEYRPAPAAPLVLEATPGKERFEDRTYTIYRIGLFGASGANDNERKETCRFRVQPVEVRLLKDGKEIWRKTAEVTSGPPFSVSLKDGESLAEKLAPYSVPNYGLLTRLELPKFLYEQLGRGVTRMSLGHSAVGPDGIDEVPGREDRLERMESLKKSLPKRSKLGSP
jgi:hypothetical protein